MVKSMTQQSVLTAEPNTIEAAPPFALAHSNVLTERHNSMLPGLRFRRKLVRRMVRLQIVDRRDFLTGSGAFVGLAFLFGPERAFAQEKPPSLDEALKKVMGEAKPTEGKLVLDLPEIAENGNTVPFTLSVESPMTEADHVKALHIFASGNPQLDVATFQFTPASGKAMVASRMRLAKTQDIIAIAELSDGKFLLSKRTVKVTIGGCGG
jgi:sulfur-oxidizing protein SoxY